MPIPCHLPGLLSKKWRNRRVTSGQRGPCKPCIGGGMMRDNHAWVKPGLQLCLLCQWRVFSGKTTHFQWEGYRTDFRWPRNSFTSGTTSTPFDMWNSVCIKDGSAVCWGSSSKERAHNTNFDASSTSKSLQIKTFFSFREVMCGKRISWPRKEPWISQQCTPLEVFPTPTSLTWLSSPTTSYFALYSITLQLINMVMAKDMGKLDLIASSASQ